MYEALDGREFLTPIVRNMAQFSGFFPGDGSRVGHCSILSEITEGRPFMSKHKYTADLGGK